MNFESVIIMISKSSESKFFLNIKYEGIIERHMMSISSKNYHLILFNLNEYFTSDKQAEWESRAFGAFSEGSTNFQVFLSKSNI